MERPQDHQTGDGDPQPRSSPTPREAMGTTGSRHCSGWVPGQLSGLSGVRRGPQDAPPCGGVAYWHPSLLFRVCRSPHELAGSCCLARGLCQAWFWGFLPDASSSLHLQGPSPRAPESRAGRALPSWFLPRIQHSARGGPQDPPRAAKWTSVPHVHPLVCQHAAAAAGVCRAHGPVCHPAWAAYCFQGRQVVVWNFVFKSFSRCPLWQAHLLTDTPTTTESCVEVLGTLSDGPQQLRTVAPWECQLWAPTSGLPTKEFLCLKHRGQA